MKNDKILEIGKNTIDIELNGIKQLYSCINNNFIKIVNFINSINGKLILSGIGKSGHIARKIASTFASTGTPAFFVHPTEALHGDLGMISKEDCAIIISNSGNSLELSGLLDFCLNKNIPIIGITHNKESTLAKSSQLLLILPKVKEACPFDKAPTTSSTTTLVLGDCLAIALSHAKNFSSEEFKSFHPGGSIGNSLKKVEEIMHIGDKIPTIKSGSNMQEALLTITSKRFGCVAVVDDKGMMIGIITDGDLRRHISNNLFHLNVDNVMTKNFSYISSFHFITEALALMKQKKITNLFVLNNKHNPIGIIHIHDLTSLL